MPAVPDGADTSTADESNLPALADDTTSLVNASGAKTVDAWYADKSILGSTIYRYHEVVEYSYNGSKVTARGTPRYDYISNSDGLMQIGARTVNVKMGVPASSAYSMMQRTVQLCIIKYGCYATNHPFVKITAHGNGSYTFTGQGQ